MDVRFENPIFVTDGPRLVREISTPGEARDFLDEWPQDLRDSTYHAVVDACRSALNLQDPVGMARYAFSWWARENGILEDVAVPTWVGAVTPGQDDKSA